MSSTEESLDVAQQYLHQTSVSWNITRSGVEESIKLSDDHPVQSFNNFLTFLNISDVPIIDLEDVEKDFEAMRSLNAQTVYEGKNMQVYPGKWNKQAVALKYFRLPDRGQESSFHQSREWYRQRMYDLLFELKIMTHKPLCDHRNIVSAFGVSFQPPDPKNTHPTLADIIQPIIVAELACVDTPDLGKYIRHDRAGEMSFEDAAGLVADIADGIAILHEYGIVHSDIKPANILIFLDSGKVVAKVADFGAAGMQASKDRPRGTTRYWTAPENLCSCAFPENRDECELGKYQLSELHTLQHRSYGDVYAFGLVTAFILLRGSNIFADSERAPFDQKMVDVVDDFVCSRITNETHKKFTCRQVCAFHELIQRTIRLQPYARLEDLSAVRSLLFGFDCFARERELQYYQKRLFAQRILTPYGKVEEIADFDKFELPMEFDIYLALPDCVREMLDESAQRKIDDARPVRYFLHPQRSPEVIHNLMRDHSVQEMEQTVGYLTKRENMLTNSSEMLSLERREEPRFKGLSVLLWQCQYCDAFTPIELANYELVIKGLLHIVPHLCKIRDGGSTLLHESCRIGDFRSAKFWLDHGADVNAVNDTGDTPLSLTLKKEGNFLISGAENYHEYGKHKAVPTIRLAKLLLSYGGKPNYPSATNSVLPRAIVAHGDYPELVDFLVQLGFNIESTLHSIPSLFCASSNGHVHQFQRLLCLGANPNIGAYKNWDGDKPYPNSNNIIPISWIESYFTLNFEVEKPSHIAMLDSWLEHGGKLQPKDTNLQDFWPGTTLIHLVVAKGMHGTLEVMLRHRPLIVHLRNASGRTPLVVAIMRRDLRAIVMLLECGADPHVRDGFGMTPIGLAAIPAATASPAIFNILHKHGVDLQGWYCTRFTRPLRLYLESEVPRLTGRGYTAIDDVVCPARDIWIKRRGINESLAVSGTCAFLRPCFWMSESSAFCLPFIIGPEGSEPKSPQLRPFIDIVTEPKSSEFCHIFNIGLGPTGFSHVKARLGMIRSPGTNMGECIIAMKFHNHLGPMCSRVDCKRLGYLYTTSLPTNHMCEVRFPGLIQTPEELSTLELKISPTTTAVDASGKKIGELPLGGLFIELLELCFQQSALDGENPESVQIATVISSTDVTDWIPKGIWTALAQEPRCVKDDGSDARDGIDGFQDLKSTILNSSTNKGSSLKVRARLQELENRFRVNQNAQQEDTAKREAENITNTQFAEIWSLATSHYLAAQSEPAVKSKAQTTFNKNEDVLGPEVADVATFHHMNERALGDDDEALQQFSLLNEADDGSDEGKIEEHLHMRFNGQEKQPLFHAHGIQWICEYFGVGREDAQELLWKCGKEVGYPCEDRLEHSSPRCEQLILLTAALELLGAAGPCHTC